MLEIVRNISAATLGFISMYFAIIAVVKPIKLSGGLILTKDAAKLRAIYFSFSVAIGTAAGEIFLPNFICIFFLLFFLIFFWLEYLIYRIKV